MDLGLNGKACIVTGASRGIGLATARMLAEEGASVLPVSRSADFQVDVTEPDAGERVVAECVERFGAVDVLVNNAGTSRVRALDELTDADWQEQWELHVMAPMRLMQAAAPRMAEAGGGRIVNVCSSSGKRPSLTQRRLLGHQGRAALALAGLRRRVRGARRARQRGRARARSRRPLWTDEGGLADQVAEATGISPRGGARAAQRAKIPLGRFGTEEEIAATIVFLCSERASNVTGAAWSVDGGSVPIIL